MPLASFVLFAAALALPFPPVPIPAGGSDPQAVQILQASLQAHGGRSAVEALRAAVLTGRSRLLLGERTDESPFRIKIRNWDQLRAFLQDKVRLRLLGRERPAQGEALRLALDLVDSDPRRIEEGRARDRTYQALIDAETLLVREMLLVSRDWDRDQPELWERWTCSDCRKAGDTLAPCRIEMRRCGRLHLEIALDSVRSQAPAGELKP